MGVSIYKIKKWTKMLLGKSIHHVSQGVGRCYSKTDVAGYYNDLTEKVLKGDSETLVPMSNIDTGEKIYFAIEVFQFGLGAYDLYLQTGQEIYKEKSLACADWAVENQQEKGGWITFAYKSKEQPYSAMAQGEGISLLLRAHKETKDAKYLDAAKKAKDFMLLPIENGGTTRYDGDDVYFLECTFYPIILNGWIFALWGIYDFAKYTEDSDAQSILQKTLKSLENKTPVFDTGWWSNYQEDGKRLCSPFYHKLHITQLNTMYDLFGSEIYKEYADKWYKYQNSFINSKKAFVKKAIQKIVER